MELEVKNKGFTLVELLIALAVFSMIVIAMSATAVSVIKSQRKGFILQESQETARYILESVGKEIRMSIIDSADTGGGSVNLLNITNARGESVDYRFSSQKFQRQIDGSGWQDLSPSNLKIDGSFYIRKTVSLPVRAAVTLVIQVSSQGRAEEETEIDLQSTLSSRSFQ
jgi:prepilin-type N-terminal cleavage/methylation domain-containing protein